MSVSIYTLTNSTGNGQTNGLNNSSQNQSIKNESDVEVDLDELSLKLFAEYDTWSDFVDAVDEFQKRTCIKLTIITSKKLKSSDKKRANADNLENHEQDEESCGSGRRSRSSNSSSSCSNNVKTPPTPKGDKSRFEYQYLKLTCKHYGKYTTTSKGIRPNQKTAKLECPTFLYASYDHYKDKFVIKQMVVNCNHELKDEDVSLPKLLQRSTPSTPDIECITTPEGASARKKYIKVHNRNILKIPLESPTPGALIMNVQKRIKCNHDLNSICQAASLTNEDLLSVHALFADKSKEDQNALIVDWITLNNYDSCAQLTPNKISKQIRSSNPDTDADTVLIQFKLPTLDGSLINVCFKAFMSILNITNARVNEVICDYYAKNPIKSLHTLSDSMDETTLVQTNKSREIETSVATILTSFNNSGNAVSVQSAELIEVVDGENQQVMIIDTVDVPTSENTIEDVFTHDSHHHHQVGENHNKMMEEVVTTSTVVPVVISDTRFEMNSVPWWRQVTEENMEEDFYCKIEPKRHINLLTIVFHPNHFELEVFGQTLDVQEHEYLASLLHEYEESKDKAHVLSRLDELTICCGISDPQLKQLANQLKGSVNQVFTYCALSDAVHSPRCRLLYGSDWSYAICRDCYSILDNTTTVHSSII